MPDRILGEYTFEIAGGAADAARPRAGPTKIYARPGGAGIETPIRGGDTGAVRDPVAISYESFCDQYGWIG